MTTRHGATAEEWFQLTVVLGLGPDLLPVVSAPGARIAADSSLRSIGKVPSRYNRAGLVVGFPSWTQHRATDAEIEKWSAEIDYGACVQTRDARFLDIDIDDRVLAERVRAAFIAKLGAALPCRYRANSGKRGLAFRLAGEWPKRVLRVEGGAVEFLGNGQQFIAAGTHPTGVRYEWEGGFPDDFPEVSAEAFEAAWAAIEAEFGTAPTVTASVTVRQRGARSGVEDPVADYLIERGLALGEDSRGAVLVACPWAAEHSGGEDGDSSTVWFRAGTNAYAKGHFKCLHAHCEGRKDAEFLAAIGYEEDMGALFDVVPSEQAAEDDLPKLERTKSGKIVAHVNNLKIAVASRRASGVVFAYDRFRDEIMVGPGGVDGWERFGDIDYTRLQLRLEAWGFLPIMRDMLRQVVRLVAADNAFDSAMLWLKHQVPAWDGVPRIEKFYVNHFGADDTAYTRAVGRYTWTALAGRVLMPGCKADMAPILVGAQGAGKSTAVAAMAPDSQFFAEISLDEREADLARRMRGKLVLELPELSGLSARAIEGTKAFLTRPFDEWVPKYQEFTTIYPRRCLIIGTTNSDAFLTDTTGNRRFLPVKVGEITPFAKLREQLWAEGRERFLLAGAVDYHEAEHLAPEAHDEFMVPDPRAEHIRRWLAAEDGLDGRKPGDRPWITTSEVAEHALGLKPGRPNARGDEIAIGGTLRTVFGYKRRKVRDGARTLWAYLRPN